MPQFASLRSFAPALLALALSAWAKKAEKAYGPGERPAVAHKAMADALNWAVRREAERAKPKR